MFKWCFSLHVLLEQVTLRGLVEELANVVDWFHFGIYLDVPHSELMKIRYDYPDVDQRKTQALSVWLKMKEGSWSEIVRALISIKMKPLATHIAMKYGEFTFTDFCQNIYDIVYKFCFNLIGVPLPPLKKELSSVGTDLPIVVEVSMYIHVVSKYRCV